MKRAYTHYNTTIKAVSKKDGVSLEEGIDLCERFIAHISKTPGTKLEDFREANVYAIDLAVLHGYSVHIFVPTPEFCDWLITCTKELNYESFCVLQDAFGEGEFTPLVIHFPTACKLPSVGVSIQPVPNSSDHLIVTLAYSYEANMGSIVTTVDPDMKFSDFMELLRTSDDRGDGGDRNHALTVNMLKLLVSLGMYVNCFPGSLTKGVPDDLAHPSQFQYDEMFTLGVVDAVKEHASSGCSSMTPHFRGGYWKTLRSERFTKKRFQAIFVRSTFVKGHAETVLSPEQVDAQAVKTAQ